jgi:predicted nucleic acid-binding protein
VKVVIDTNVLVSAAWRDRDPELVILWIAAEPGREWVMSAEILAEYIEVLSRPKFKLTEAQRQRRHDLMNAVATLIVDTAI